MDDPFAAERRRILDAYARRQASGRGAAGWFELEDEAHLLRLQERLRRTRRLLAGAGITSLADRRVLDVGCGDGRMLLELLAWGAAPEQLAGIDLRPGPLARARAVLPRCDLRQGCATSLPWPDGRFDLVSQHTAMSSILDPAMRRRVAAEMARVLRGGGAILWYDSRRDNPSNPDVRGVPAAEIRRLFPGFAATVETLTFLPHVARRLPVALLAAAYPLLAAVPAWRTHHLALLVKPD